LTASEIDQKIKALVQELTELKRSINNSLENRNIPDEVISKIVRVQHQGTNEPIKLKAYTEHMKTDLAMPSVWGEFDFDAKFNKLLRSIVQHSRLTDIEKGKTGIGYCVSIDELLAFGARFHQIKDFLLDSIGHYAIEENNAAYALFAFNKKDYICDSMVETAIKHNRLDLMLQLIHQKIVQKVMTQENCYN
jgi:hypothetical protein